MSVAHFAYVCISKINKYKTNWNCSHEQCLILNWVKSWSERIISFMLKIINKINSLFVTCKRQIARENRVLRSAVAFYCLIRRRYFRCYFFFAFWPAKFGHCIVCFSYCLSCIFFSFAVGIFNEAIYTNLILSSVCAVVFLLLLLLLLFSLFS